MGRYEAADYLARVLSAPGAYRRRWERTSHVPTPPGEINLPAVCSVLADYLIDQGEMSDHGPSPKRRIRDRVRRALSGEVLTLSTVRSFGGAFEFTESDVERLESLLSGSSLVRVLSGGYRGSPSIEPARPGYRIISLHDRHYVGADRLPQRHRTSQVIEAVDDGVRTHRYTFDSSALAVEVLHGGEIGGDVAAVGGGLYAVDIVLTRPLRQGETTSLVYETRFRYPEPPAPEFRRAGVNRVENVDLLVQFDPMSLPREVYFGTWSALDGDPDEESRAVLERDGSARVFLAGMERAIAGFRWVW